MRIRAYRKARGLSAASALILMVALLATPVVASAEDEASLSLDKTVYLGHDGGAGCPGADVVKAPADSAITYCFVIANTGGVTLDRLAMVDALLGITLDDTLVVSGDPDAALEPGATLVVAYETTLVADMVNIADAGAFRQGDPSSRGAEAVASDTATVQLDEPSQPEPDIEIQKTVYAGHNNGASCPGIELVFDEIGADITYCFEVTNTGNTHLADVTVSDPDLGITDTDMILASGNPTLLAPDAVVVWYYETTLNEDLVNTATTTGTPADEDGNDIPATPPSDDDDAEVSEEGVLAGELPRTGFSTRQVATFGMVMLLLGTGLLGATGRREQVASIVTAMGKTPRLWTIDD